MVPFLARVPYHGLRRAGFDDIHHAAQNGVAQLHGRIRIIHAIHRPFASNPEFPRRFRREVEAARRVPRYCTAAVIDAVTGFVTRILDSRE